MVGVMFDSIKDILAMVALGASGISVYIGLKTKSDKAEIKNEYKDLISDRSKAIYERMDREITKVEETIKSSINLKYHHIDQIKKQANEIENFVMAEIKVLKSQIADRDRRLDKLEEKIDQVNNKLIDIREIIIGIAKGQK